MSDVHLGVAAGKSLVLNKHRNSNNIVIKTRSQKFMLKYFQLTSNAKIVEQLIIHPEFSEKYVWVLVAVSFL